MPPSNMIAAVQERYDGLTSFTGKPSRLWFGEARPKDVDGTKISYPVVEFTHDGTPTEASFEGTCTESWQFTLDVYAETVQEAVSLFDRVRFNGADPTSRSGFWMPDSVTVPAGYTFLHLIPTGPFRVIWQSDRYGPSGAPLVQLTWPFELMAERLTFS